MNLNKMRQRSGLFVMMSLVGLVRPLLPIMCLAIFLGVLGFLCAIFLTIFAGYGVVHGIFDQMGLAVGAGAPILIRSWGFLFASLIIMAVSRGLLHYGEQYCNHFIAFKLLAIIRHKVFAKLRELCPAKLEGRKKGDLIALITSDIELLEVFYAHTLSPMAIGALTSLILVLFIGAQHPLAGLLALVAYGTVGICIPIWNGRRGAECGMAYRKSFAGLGSLILESLYGLDETIQYGAGQERMTRIEDGSRELAGMQKVLSRLEGSQRSVTNLAIQFFSLSMLGLTACLHYTGVISFGQMLIATIAMMSSFGPVVALSNLSNNLNQTLACGERVLSLLEEQAEVREITEGEEVVYQGAEVSHVDFSYEEEPILTDYSLTLPQKKIVGIHGASGSGKSTLLKLLMRFWDVQGGGISLSGRDLREIRTGNLRDMESYVTQETWLFHDTIANNIALGDPHATREDIAEAARKASIHDFIESLPQGYDTPVGELGDTLSGGERQRIGIARAFLHRAPVLLLDEPTSNLDSLNEGIILKSLAEDRSHDTVVLVSHRRSTMGIADLVYEMDGGRIS